MLGIKEDIDLEMLYAIVALVSAIAAVLAWVAKLVWSKQHLSAKDEIIRAKEAQIDLLNNQIESLRELTPMKLREYFLSVKEQLEEFNITLSSELENATSKIEKKEEEIKLLKAAGQEQEEKIQEISVKLDSLRSSRNEKLHKLGNLDKLTEETKELEKELEPVGAWYLLFGQKFKEDIAKEQALGDLPETLTPEEIKHLERVAAKEHSYRALGIFMRDNIRKKHKDGDE